MRPKERRLLTAAAWDIAPMWLEQLRPDGRFVLPLSLRGPQKSVAFKRADRHLESVSITDCSFMGLRGEFA